MNNEFTLEQWAQTKGVAYESSPEANEEISAAAKAFAAVCIKHQLPCVALWQGRQTEDGSFSLGAEADLVSLERVGPAILFASLLHAETDPAGAIHAVMKAFFQRQAL